jgi:hypothetical protein
MTVDEIISELRTKAWEASRKPDAHKAEIHNKINALLDAWELHKIAELGSE